MAAAKTQPAFAPCIIQEHQKDISVITLDDNGLCMSWQRGQHVTLSWCLCTAIRIGKINDHPDSINATRETKTKLLFKGTQKYQITLGT